MKTINNKQYELWAFSESPEINHWGIRFIDGEFKGVVVEVTNFSSPDYEDGDKLGDVLDNSEQVNLSIEFNVIHAPEDFPLHTLSTDHFKQTFDEAITEVIKDTAKGYHDQNRNVDIIEPDSQRAVH
jgi:hypothetical protein